MDSKRLQVKKKLTEILKRITVANGFQHDLANSVWRGRMAISESEMPCLVIVDVIPEESSYAGSSVHRSNFEIGIKGFSKPDMLNPTDPAENLMADIKKALAPAMDDGGAGQPSADFCLGGLVGSVQVDTGVVFPPDNGSDAAFCVVKVSLDFVERVEDPYAS